MKKTKNFLILKSKKLSDYLKVEVSENKDAIGQTMMCFWLKKRNGRKITCVFNLLDLETIRIVLEELDKVE